MPHGLAQIDGKRLLGSVVLMFIALSFMAPLLARLVNGGRLGATPGLFLIGASALVAVASLVFDAERQRPWMDHLRNGLLVAGVVALFVGAMLLSD